MAGYIRQDVSNNIANGNVINADDFDNEFDAIASAFNTSTGHSHDGSSAEGAPIEVLGPVQDYLAGATSFSPKTTNLYDLGSSSLGWRDLYITRNLAIGGTLDLDSLSISGVPVTSTAGELNILDGVTVSSAELNKLDGATWSTGANGETTFADGVNEGFTSVTSSSGTADVNCRNGNVFAITLSENTTFTFSNPPTTGTAYGFVLKVVQDSTARTVTWPASVDWASSISPTLSVGSGDVDIFVFLTHDGGTTWYGIISGQDFA